MLRQRKSISNKVQYVYFKYSNIAFKQTNNLPQGKYNAMPVKSIAALLANISKHLLMGSTFTER
jgi:hypothetical protein